MIAKKLSKWTGQEIKQFFATAQAAIKTKELTILWAPLFSHNHFGKLLMTTPRKIGSAPQRNTLRRQLKAIFYQEKLYEKGKHIAVLLRPGATQISFEQLKTMLKQAADR